jgi:hypothetical protein
MNVRSRRRAGRHVKRRLRGEILAVARRHWRMLAVVLGGWVMVTAALTGFALAVGQTHWAAFLGGLMLGLAPLLWESFLAGQGFAHRKLGGEAETWTAEKLAKLDDRIWRVYHDVPLSHGNIDHVVVGPGRIYAVETKWSGAREETRFLKGGARQAARNAKALQAILGERGCKRQVLPLLVVWGGGVADGLGEAPQLWGETRVVVGHHSEVWLERIRQAADRLEVDWPAQQAIERLVLDGHVREEPFSIR